MPVNFDNKYISEVYDGMRPGMPEFDLGQMKSENGSVLTFEVDELASNLAYKIIKILKQRSAYKKLNEIINNENMNLYFQRIIIVEIKFSIIQLCVLRWHKKKH